MCCHLKGLLSWCCMETYQEEEAGKDVIGCAESRRDVEELTCAPEHVDVDPSRNHVG